MQNNIDGSVNLKDVIEGLAGDMKALRKGKISIQQARASAELGKQIFSGAKVMIQARKMLEDEAFKIEGSAITSDKKGN